MLTKVLTTVGSFLLPGSGQAYLGRLRRGVVWAAAATVLIIVPLWLPHLALSTVAIRFAAAIDTLLIARRLGTTGERRIDMAGAVVAAQVIAIFLLRVFVIEGFKLPASSMSPTLVIGDHAFADKLTPRLTGYHRGDIAVFDHPLVDVKFVKRIIAVGGDDVAVRGGVVYVNGTAVRQTRIGDATYWDYYEGSGEWVAKQVVAYREVHGDHDYVVYREPLMPSEKYDRADFPVPLLDGDGDPCAATGDPGLGMMNEGRARADRPRMHLTADRTACKVPPGTYFMLGDNRNNSNDSRSWGIVPASMMVGRMTGIWWSSTDRGGVDWGRIGRID